jgi:cytochrome bd-type quinol oxidase subunit 2
MNIKYIRTNDRYVKEYIAHILNEGFWFLLYIATASIVVFFGHKLLFSYCIQTKNETEEDKKKRDLEKANIYHCLLMLVMIWLVVFKTSEIYDSKMEHLFTFRFSALFKILVGVYMMCATLIRLSLSSQIYTVYGIMLTLLSFLPIIYIICGEELQKWLD